MDDINRVLGRVTEALKDTPGVYAVVLGGSRARGNPAPDSDIDIGLYYDHYTLDVSALDRRARALDDAHREGLVFAPGQWGKWVDGGAWLTVDGMHLDLILREIGRVKGVIGRCLSGRVEAHYQTGHPHAFVDAAYMGELATCKLLFARDESIPSLKRTAERYPDALGQALIGFFSFEAGFSLTLAEKTIERDDRYYVVGHIVRAISALNQVLFAVNRAYLINEKKAVQMIDGFPVRPENYKARIDAVLSDADLMRACRMLRALVDDALALTGDG